jgi:hypothetical protein
LFWSSSFRGNGVRGMRSWGASAID